MVRKFGRHKVILVNGHSFGLAVQTRDRWIGRPVIPCPNRAARIKRRKGVGMVKVRRQVGRRLGDL